MENIYHLIAGIPVAILLISIASFAVFIMDHKSEQEKQKNKYRERHYRKERDKHYSNMRD